MKSTTQIIERITHNHEREGSTNPVNGMESVLQHKPEQATFRDDDRTEFLSKKQSLLAKVCAGLKMFDID